MKNIINKLKGMSDDLESKKKTPMNKLLGVPKSKGNSFMKALDKSKHLGDSHSRWSEGLKEIKDAPRTKGKKLDGGHTFKFK